MWGGHAFAWNFHSLPLSDNNSEGGRLLFLQKEGGLYWSGLMGVNMQINVTTDYAIRIVLYLAIQNKVTTSKDIAMAMGIPKSYIFKITNKLIAAGIIQRIVGAKGGFILDKRVEEISMYEIFKVMEATVKINRYLEGDDYCKCFETQNCSLRKFYSMMQSSLENTLKATMIKDVLDINK